MKKMLIMNGGHSEIPLIKEAKELGYYVITSGNKPDLIGHQYADEYIMGDFSDKEKMLKFGLENQIDAVCSSANDFGAISAAYVAEKMHLPGHDPYQTALMLHRKDLFKQFAKDNGLLSPVSQIFADENEALSSSVDLTYPVIVKPVDLTGGKGVSKASSDDEYSVAVKNAFVRSREKKIVVEPFIQGTYHSFSTFLVQQKVVAFFSDNEYSNVYRFFVDTSAGPADDVDLVKDRLIGQAEIVAKKLNLVNGVFHMQYIKDNENNPWIIDITRRCSGDVYPEPVEHATGIPWARWIVMSEAGYDETYFKECGEQKKNCGRHCIMAPTEGTVKDVIISEELKKNIYGSMLWWKPGDLVYNHYTDKLGILFLEYSDRKEMLDKASRIKELVKVIVR